ncbi:MAG: MbnP family protein [Bacteroidia bacterium]
MKQFLLILLSVFCLHIAGFAQTNVTLNINHKLASDAFALNKKAQNNMNEDFEVTRLQYYISNIELTHDGGTVTSMSGVYVLVDGSVKTSVDLGDQNITNLEKVSFYIGVDNLNNHNDPALWPATHPLAPQLPSMHWGWTSGYRFIAVEGKSGANMGQSFELHGLGDSNYGRAEIAMNASAADGELPIYLDADYTRVLENIQVSSGVIEHGEGGAAKTGIENFRNFVFSAGSPTTGLETDLSLQSLSVFPNPSTNGKATVAIEMAQQSDLQLLVVDALGRKVFETSVSGTSMSAELTMPKAGLYFLSVMKDGVRIGVEKLMVQ